MQAQPGLCRQHWPSEHRKGERWLALADPAPKEGLGTAAAGSRELGGGLRPNVCRVGRELALFIVTFYLDCNSGW